MTPGTRAATVTGILPAGGTGASPEQSSDAAGAIDGDPLDAPSPSSRPRPTSSSPPRSSTRPNRRLIAHLRNERDARPPSCATRALRATNHEAERAIRPQVCMRKNWSGNKSEAGARAEAVLGSVLRTSDQQGNNPIDVLVAIATTNGRRNGLDLGPGPGP